MNSEPTLCVTRTRPESSRTVGTRTVRTPVAVLADQPVYAHGLAELIRRIVMFDVVGVTTEVDDVVDLVGRGSVRLVVISSQQVVRHALGRISAAATAAGETVRTVQVITSDESWPVDDADVRPSAVVTTDDGVDGLARAVFEARHPRRSPMRAVHRSRPSSVSRPLRGGRPALTPRELEVLQGLADGLTSKDIAERLGVSVHTVRTHVQRLLPKLGVHTRLRATAVALEEGLVAQPGASRLASRYATTAAGERSAGTAG